jgi:hypothetical protein
MPLHNLPRVRNSDKNIWDRAITTTEVGMTQVVFDVSAFINSRHVGAVQYGIAILCGLMMFLDGLDTQAIS